MDELEEAAMSRQALFQLVELPYCQAVMIEQWDAAPGRFFVAYRSHGNFCRLLGQGVVDEFHTISAPILISPSSIMGGVYDAGMRLADDRDLEAPIDQGWPPMTVGIDTAVPAMDDNWQRQLLDAIKSGTNVATATWDSAIDTVKAGAYAVSKLSCTVNGVESVSCYVTDAPLLPQQLLRVAESGNALFSAAVSTGNRLPRVARGELHQIDVASEEQLLDIVRVANQIP
jgi:hypothetical protein